MLMELMKGGGCFSDTPLVLFRGEMHYGAELYILLQSQKSCNYV